MTMNDFLQEPPAPGPSFHLLKAAHDPRAAALEAVSKVLANEVDAQEALDGALQSPSMVPSDKGLCTELFYGQLRAHLRLQAFSGRFFRKPDKLPWEMRLTVDQALYSMAYLRVPQRAAVHWAVEHIRNRFGKVIAGVANGALRSMQRQLASFKAAPEDVPHPAGTVDQARTWTLRYSMPEWIVRLWLDAYGQEQCRDLLEISSVAPPQAVRLNMAKPDWQTVRDALLAEGEETERDGAPVLVSDCALMFPKSLPHAVRQLVDAGRASRQSAGSYAALAAFEPEAWQGPVWDCCAGRGGKTLALLERKVEVVVASDPSRRRLQALPKELERLGLPEASRPVLLLGSAMDAASGWDALAGQGAESTARPLPELFGAILVDAPCSGLGTMSRYPEIRFRRTSQDCAGLVELQREILDAAWQRLKPGGSLMYLTCTANPAENEQQAAAFLERHTDAVLADEYSGGDWRSLREYFYGARLDKRA